MIDSRLELFHELGLGDDLFDFIVLTEADAKPAPSDKGAETAEEEGDTPPADTATATPADADEGEDPPPETDEATPPDEGDGTDPADNEEDTATPEDGTGGEMGDETEPATPTVGDRLNREILFDAVVRFSQTIFPSLIDSIDRLLAVSTKRESSELLSELRQRAQTAIGDCNKLIREFEEFSPEILARLVASFEERARSLHSTLEHKIDDGT